ncbi:MAG: hypothetical protein HQ551_10495 [Desulfobacteraceae bacterium]|nr:hypothetical protein [Desulfobacteraceae bacterium]
MSVFDAADAFLQQSEDIVTQNTRKQKLKLYCEGLKAKARQVELALQELVTLENQTDAAVTSTDTDEPSIQAKVEFYCDSFWAFLYSCLDVLGQVVNQGMKLGFDEKAVSFKTIKNHLNSNHNGSPEQTAFDECARCNAFKNVDRYRNCSTHRRQIYVKEEVKLVRHPDGYQTITTGDNVTVERILCENPLDVRPRTTQNRKIPDYLLTTRDRIFGLIEKILSSSKAVR